MIKRSYPHTSIKSTTPVSLLVCINQINNIYFIVNMKTLNLRKDMSVEFHESFGQAQIRLTFMMLILQMLHTIGWSLNARNIKLYGKGSLPSNCSLCNPLDLFVLCFDRSLSTDCCMCLGTRYNDQYKHWTSRSHWATTDDYNLYTNPRQSIHN